jgi:hypothetical protein
MMQNSLGLCLPAFCVPLFANAAYVNQPERSIASGFIFVINALILSCQAEKTIPEAVVN